MIAPAVTVWPAKTFTPSRCALESRPLREDPPPFLCAIFVSFVGRFGLGGGLDPGLGRGLGRGGGLGLRLGGGLGLRLRLALASGLGLGLAGRLATHLQDLDRGQAGAGAAVAADAL